MTIVPIDNKEIQSFYDPHWNIPKDYQTNWLKYIFVEEKLKAEEAGEILRVIEESGMETNEEEWIKNLKFNRNLLLQYLQERKKEEKIVRKKSARIKEVKANLKKYGLSDKKINSEDIAKWDKEDKRKKSKPVKMTEGLKIDLDQENQEPQEEKLSHKKAKNKKKKS